MAFNLLIEFKMEYNLGFGNEILIFDCFYVHHSDAEIQKLKFRFLVKSSNFTYSIYNQNFNFIWSSNIFFLNRNESRLKAIYLCMGHKTF